jgi:hypothetical protein
VRWNGRVVFVWGREDEDEDALLDFVVSDDGEGESSLDWKEREATTTPTNCAAARTALRVPTIVHPISKFQFPIQCVYDTDYKIFRTWRAARESQIRD